MLDIGLGEIVVIAIIALLVFGPDRLPKAAADAARALRQLRQVASSARQELVNAAGVDEGGELAEAMGHLRELDPRRALDPRLDPEPRRAGSPTERGRSTTGHRVAPASPGGSVGIGPGASGVIPTDVQADTDWT